MPSKLARFALPATMLLFLTMPALAKGSHGGNDRAAFGTTIVVPEGASVGDVACAFCSVEIHGQVMGDVAVFMGSVKVDSGQSIGGDTAIAGGDLKLGDGSTVNGDVAILGGEANLADGAAIHGSRSIITPPLGTLILCSPLLFLAGIIWLIVYLVRRSRYRFPMYPQGRGIQGPPLR
ncbi:polymer-forming cytoskeletal protein [Edaphobacter flagellatus]|uniref:polymer-forming cytoskeletal protein n=1 Tax=Edaphobacter flagellatus TaxID=1933044 RepID=UPI0021B331A3|nr:polymer-forming cytoskeletal protein [Edaphobacter flagellatus]